MRATIRCLIAATSPARPPEITASDDDKMTFITDYGSSVSVPNTISVTAPGRQSKTFLMLKGKSARRSRTRPSAVGIWGDPDAYEIPINSYRGRKTSPHALRGTRTALGQVSREESRKSQIVYWWDHRKC